MVPLLLLQSGPDASASVGAARHPSAPVAAAPDRTPRPPSRVIAPARHHRASPSGPPVVIDDQPLRSDVPTTIGSVPHATTTTSTSPAPSTTTTTTTTPTTTTTTTTVPAPVAGSAVETTGQVTYYAHPAGRCASPWLPFGTVVRVTNPANGASVTCVVDDREADTARSIDLATATFAEIAPLSQGVVDARLSW